MKKTIFACAGLMALTLFTVTAFASEEKTERYENRECCFALDYPAGYSAYEQPDGSVVIVEGEEADFQISAQYLDQTTTRCKIYSAEDMAVQIGKNYQVLTEWLGADVQLVDTSFEILSGRGAFCYDFRFQLDGEDYVGRQYFCDGKGAFGCYSLRWVVNEDAEDSSLYREQALAAIKSFQVTGAYQTPGYSVYTETIEDVDDCIGTYQLQFILEDAFVAQVTNREEYVSIYPVSGEYSAANVDIRPTVWEAERDVLEILNKRCDYYFKYHAPAQYAMEAERLAAGRYDFVWTAMECDYDGSAGGHYEAIFPAAGMYWSVNADFHDSYYEAVAAPFADAIMSLRIQDAYGNCIGEDCNGLAALIRTEAYAKEHPAPFYEDESECETEYTHGLEHMSEAETGYMPENEFMSEAETMYMPENASMSEAETMYMPENESMSEAETMYMPENGYMSEIESEYMTEVEYMSETESEYMSEYGDRSETEPEYMSEYETEFMTEDMSEYDTETSAAALPLQKRAGLAPGSRQAAIKILEDIEASEEFRNSFEPQAALGDFDGDGKEELLAVYEAKNELDGFCVKYEWWSLQSAGPVLIETDVLYREVGGNGGRASIVKASDGTVYLLLERDLPEGDRFYFYDIYEKWDADRRTLGDEYIYMEGRGSNDAEGQMGLDQGIYLVGDEKVSYEEYMKKRISVGEWLCTLDLLAAPVGDDAGDFPYIGYFQDIKGE